MEHALFDPDPKPRALVFFCALGSVLLVLVWLLAGCGPSPASHSDAVSLQRPKGTVTFNKDVAPIIFQNCSSCHRPGESAPFSFLSYKDVKKRADQILEVIGTGYMPPWMPAHGYGQFAGERRLTPEQIRLIKQWAEEGAVEGKADDLPSLPVWPEGWQLGQPDLVVQMPEPYELAPDGRDVYRNFVIPVPVSSRRYVEAVEFRPGSTKALHHTFIRVDTTGQCRRLDEQDAEVGIPGMDMPPSARIPDGQFLSWQPGKVPLKSPPGLSWTLEPGTDFVLQIHMQPTGKPEMVQPSIGLFFTDQAPTNAPFKIGLRSLDIDVPAGVSNQVVENSYVLPVDVDVLSVLPHAHYLGKDIQGFAVLPDGNRKELLWIKDWDFNWQGDYLYASPVFLPKGSRLSMRISYDNSTNNVRNPFHPPQRVQYGVETTDEMGEIWFQVLPRNPWDRPILARDYQPVELEEILAFNRYRLRKNPDDARAHCQMAQAFLALGKEQEAHAHLTSALRARPDEAEAHYYLGILHRSKGRLEDARREFDTVIRLDPGHYKAHGNLGLMALQQGDTAAAEGHFRRALAAHPRDTMAFDMLGLIYLERGDLVQAEEKFRAALKEAPNDPDVQQHLRQVLERKGQSSR